MSPSMKYVLVTGTNGGLGLGICTRLLDDFLQTQPATSSLTLIFTTRSTRKGNETLRVLQSHLSKHHPSKSQARIHLQPENVELTNLLNIRTLSHKLLGSKIPYLNAVILNAGIGGWSGLDWFQAVSAVLSNIVTNTTWPKYKLGISGLITENQTPASETKAEEEPPLGQIFCANLFGHYMLVHWLMPLLRSCDAAEPARIIWVSSIEPMASHFKKEDLMGLKTTSAYESSKRATDLLALTYDTAGAKRSYTDFTSIDEDSNAWGDIGIKRTVNSTPSMHTIHPGICATAIVTLYWIVHQAFVLCIYLARWVGSPWATVSTYTAAISFTWMAFAPAAEIRAKEAQVGQTGKGGRVKWGTAVDRMGNPTIRPTEVEGWGLDGSGEAFATTFWGGGWGRAPGARDADAQEVIGFRDTGVDIWLQMERLRVLWESILVDVR